MKPTSNHQFKKVTQKKANEYAARKAQLEERMSQQAPVTCFRSAARFLV
jgi:hypothetical protein